MSKVDRLSLKTILSTKFHQASPTRAPQKVHYTETGPTCKKRSLTSCVTILGKWEKIGGVDSYVATPTGEYPQNKAILFLADAFGPQLINNQVRSSITWQELLLAV